MATTSLIPMQPANAAEEAVATSEDLGTSAVAVASPRAAPRREALSELAAAGPLRRRRNARPRLRGP